MTQNIAASVRQRLLNHARAEGRPFNEVLQYFADEKQAQWAAFISRHRLEDTPTTLQEAIQVIAAFLQPVIHALLEGQRFDRRWSPGGPWISSSER